MSVIMNCYNSAEYLREALDSVLAQTYSDWEVVFWDNQSSDESASIFKSYADKRFHYYRASEHAVLGQARNLAVEQARGEWVAFLDCDDLWFSEKLEKQIAIICSEDSDLGLVYGRAQRCIEDGGVKTGWGRRQQNYIHEKKWHHFPEGNIFSPLLKENFVPLVSAVARRSAYQAVGGIDPALTQSEDYDLFLKISKDFKARAVQEAVCVYRVHGSNLSHSQVRKNYEEAVTIVSRYLPEDEARQGIRSHQTAFAANEIREGHIAGGLKRLLLYGDVLLFMSKVSKYVWQKIFPSTCPERSHRMGF